MPKYDTRVWNRTTWKFFWKLCAVRVHRECRWCGDDRAEYVSDILRAENRKEGKKIRNTRWGRRWGMARYHYMVLFTFYIAKRGKRKCLQQVETNFTGHRCWKFFLPVKSIWSTFNEMRFFEFQIMIVCTRKPRIERFDTRSNNIRTRISRLFKFVSPPPPVAIPANCFVRGVHRIWMQNLRHVLRYCTKYNDRFSSSVNVHRGIFFTNYDSFSNRL